MPKKTNQFDKETILRLLKEHKEYMTSMNAWNIYSKEYGLPHSQTIIKHFGSWNSAKSALSLEQLKKNLPFRYTEQELLQLYEQHKDKFTSITNWNDYASKNQLPTYYTFVSHLGKDLVEQNSTSVTWDKEKLTQLILTYYPEEPPTVSNWRTMEKKYDLPSHMTIVRHFQSWSLMKSEVYSN